MDFHAPYTFDSRDTYLAASRQWANDYAVISAKRRQAKRDIAAAFKAGEVSKAAGLQYDLSVLPKDAVVALQKRAAMKEEACEQVLARKEAIVT